MANEKAISRAVQGAGAPLVQQKPMNINQLMDSILDGDKMRKRFDELLGKRAPQFISSVISLVNAEPKLQQAMLEAPNTVVQAALKAAMYDLPVDPALGYAYILPFKNNKKGIMEASFIMGYKGMEQLAVRSGAYKRLPDAVDVREGELLHYDRLSGDAEFAWIEDEEERDALPVIGYAGYFRLLNGAEKTIYMTKKQIISHEKKNRKGQDQGKMWRTDFDAMARKTVIRRLISKYGLMSIDYRFSADEQNVTLATAIAAGDLGDPEDQVLENFSDFEELVNDDTGEVIGGEVAQDAAEA